MSGATVGLTWLKEQIPSETSSRYHLRQAQGLPGKHFDFRYKAAGVDHRTNARLEALESARRHAGVSIFGPYHCIILSIWKRPFPRFACFVGSSVVGLFVFIFGRGRLMLFIVCYSRMPPRCIMRFRKSKEFCLSPSSIFYFFIFLD